MKCQKLIFEEKGSRSILLGLVEGEDEFFIWFRTARRTHIISKGIIISIVDTDEEFKENGSSKE